MEKGLVVEQMKWLYDIETKSSLRWHCRWFEFSKYTRTVHISHDTCKPHRVTNHVKFG